MDKHQQHPDAAAWERLALDEVGGPERAAWFDHITACESCTLVWRGVLALQADARGEGLLASAAPVATSWSRSSMTYLAMAATLVLVVAGVFISRPTGDAITTTTMRSVQSVEVGGLSAVVGADGAMTFSWSPLATATGYRIGVFSEDGLPVWTHELAAPPAHWIAMPRGAKAYKWRVEALAAGAVMARSRLADLEVVP